MIVYCLCNKNDIKICLNHATFYAPQNCSRNISSQGIVRHFACPGFIIFVGGGGGLMVQLLVQRSETELYLHEP